MNVLLTGGLGYIGSHTALALASNSHNVVLLDNFSNSTRDNLSRLQSISSKKLEFIEGDVRDETLLCKILEKYHIDAVVHCAALKSPVESEVRAIEYLSNNISGSISLLAAMSRCGVNNLVFSSSATVYGHPLYNPVDEDHPLSPATIYGITKQRFEDILRDLTIRGSPLNTISLRYFNPAGAHPSGAIGETPNGIPNNLFPYLCEVIGKKRSHLNIYGGDYPTPDGTGVRDYIHVCDIAQGHVSALNKIGGMSGFQAINLGTGTGHSVRSIVRTFEEMLDITIPSTVCDRRIGDSAICVASGEKAKRLLAWEAKRSLHEMCESSLKFYWRIQSHNK